MSTAAAVATRALVVPDVTGMGTLDAALTYVAAGFWLVPTRADDIKNPGSMLGRSWQRHSSRDPDQIRDWFGMPDRGIALHTGPSGICAFDLDTPSAIPPMLLQAIAQGNPPHQSTRRSTRGRGHYLFATDPARPPGSSAKAVGPGWGDVRCGNTVIILAPTPHPNPDGQYQWISTGTLPPLPSELARLLSEPAVRADNEAADALAQQLADAGPPDERMMELLRPCLDQISSGVCRHDTMRAAQLALVDAAAGGHRGLVQALQWLREAFENQIGDDPSRAGEFDRTLQGAFAIKSAEIASGLFDVEQPQSSNGSGPAPQPPVPEPADDRPLVMVDADRLRVIRSLNEALLNRYNGTTLFNYGGAVAALEGHRTRLLRAEDWPLWLAHTVRTMTRKGNDRLDAWPDGQTMMALRASHDDYAYLERVARAPFLRRDGSVCDHPGYDPASQTVLVLDPTVSWPQIPEMPTAEQIEAARWALLTDWLGDMPFEADSDRANALATVLTPFIRGNVPLSPLAVVDGTQMGVGKNLLADCISIVACGTPALPLPYTRDDDETRKAILSAFRTGTDLFIFDEAHFVTGAALARALTSITYTDRLLGVSQMLEFPNRVTWMSLGNNVQVQGDMSRRVYRIRLAPGGANPETRPNEQFAHPDLRGWTQANRPRLVGACLTLVRAWYGAGCPASSKPVSMGSFEAWERVIGGVLELAGVPGLLEGTAQWRSEADQTVQYWQAHLHWLAQTFPNGQAFSSGQVRAALLQRADPGFSGEEDVTPPFMFDTDAKDYAFRLGLAYAKIIGRDFGGIRMIRPPSPTAEPGTIPRTGKVARWMVASD